MVAASMAHIFRKSLRDRPPSLILSAMVCSRANLYPPHLWPLSTLYQLVEAANDEKNHVLPGKTPDISRNRHGKVISQQGKKRFQKGEGRTREHRARLFQPPPVKKIFPRPGC